MAGRGARGSDDVKRVHILLDARRVPRGSRWLGLSQVVKDDLKAVLILLDGWVGCTWVRLCKEGTYILDG